MEYAGYVKIGHSTEPNDRLKHLQIGNPDKLTILRVIKCMNYTQIEKDLHAKYAYLREQGEWFKMTWNEIDDAVKWCESRVRLV